MKKILEGRRINTMDHQGTPAKLQSKEGSRIVKNKGKTVARELGLFSKSMRGNYSGDPMQDAIPVRGNSSSCLVTALLNTKDKKLF